jgi:hypothetical protein
MNAAPRCSTRMEYWVRMPFRKPILGDLAARTGFGSAGAFHRCGKPFGPPSHLIARADTTADSRCNQPAALPWGRFRSAACPKCLQACS